MPRGLRFRRAGAKWAAMRSTLTCAVSRVAICLALAPSVCVIGQQGPVLISARGIGPQPAIAVGNFTGHGYSDVAYLREDKAVLATTPLMLDSYDSIAGQFSVRDLATRRGGNTRNRDGLVLATGGGIYQWDPVGPMPRLDSRLYSRVVTADIDGDLIDDLVGIDDVGSTVYTKTFAPQGQPTPFASIQFSGEIVRAVATVDWDIDGQRELAVATSQRLWIGNPFTGQSIFSYPIANSRSLLVEFRSRRDELVAWVTRTQGRDTLTVVGPGVFQQTLLTGWNVGSVAVGDVDNNGRHDLAFSLENSSTAYLMVNQTGVPSSTTTFGLGAGQYLRLNLDFRLPTGVSNVGRLWFGDMDGDRVSELVIPSAFDGRLAIASTPALGGPPATLRPEILGLSCSAVMSTDPTRVGDVIGVNMSLPITHLTGAPADANGVQLLLYGAVLRSGGELGSEFRTQPTIEVDAIGAFLPGGPAPNVINFRIAVPDGWNYANIGDFNRGLAGVLRYVRTDSRGDVAQAWPPRYVGMALNNLVYQLPTFPGEPELRMSPGGGAPTTGYVEPPRLPPKVSTAVVPTPVH